MSHAPPFSTASGSGQAPQLSNRLLAAASFAKNIAGLKELNKLVPEIHAFRNYMAHNHYLQFPDDTLAARAVNRMGVSESPQIQAAPTIGGVTRPTELNLEVYLNFGRWILKQYARIDSESVRQHGMCPSGQIMDSICVSSSTPSSHTQVLLLACHMPLVAKLKQPHISPDKSADCISAHNLLIGAGYQFVGYHGTTLETMERIVPHGFDPRYIGSGSGSERGDGFYVSHQPNLARDYAVTSTQTGADPTDMGGGKFVSPLYPGTRGQPALLRIYAYKFDLMRLNLEIKWGLQNTAVDASNTPEKHGNLEDRTVLDASGRSIERFTDMELIFHARDYDQLAAIPSFSDQLDKQLDVKRGAWPNHEHHDASSTNLSSLTKYWHLFSEARRSSGQPFLALTRQASEPSREKRSAHMFHRVVYSILRPLNLHPSYYRDAGIFSFNVEKDMKRAGYRLTIAAAGADDIAATLLGTIYENGQGVEIDFAHAMALYHRAALRGNASALWALGRYFEVGIIVKAEPLFAALFYKTADQSASALGKKDMADYARYFAERHPIAVSRANSADHRNFVARMLAALPVIPISFDPNDIETAQKAEQLYQQGLQLAMFAQEPSEVEAEECIRVAAALRHHAATVWLRDKELALQPPCASTDATEPVAAAPSSASFAPAQ